MIKVTYEEINSFFKDVVSIRPKTMVYLFGILFIIAWLVGERMVSLLFLFLCTGALIYKHWISGDWKHAARQEYLKKAKEQMKNAAEKK